MDLRFLLLRLQNNKSPEIRLEGRGFKHLSSHGTEDSRCEEDGHRHRIGHQC